ncbi:MAG: hypothetical protein ACK5Q5_16685 [Planctomycetaceae bacterium]
MNHLKSNTAAPPRCCPAKSVIRKWGRGDFDSTNFPAAHTFLTDRPALLESKRLQDYDLTFLDRLGLIVVWLDIQSERGELHQ